MTTARNIIQDGLTFGLNRLSPGETLNPDTGAICLTALNSIAHEVNGVKAFLLREILTASSAITGQYGTLGTDWAGLSAGDQILGATVQYSATLDVPMDPITMGQYANISIKSVTTYPSYYAHDGQSKVYLYPAATGHVITLRTQQVMSDFADLDTDYVMQKRYKSALSDWLAEKMAPSLVGSVSPDVASRAKKARQRLLEQNIDPAIMGAMNIGLGPVARIRRGF